MGCLLYQPLAGHKPGSTGRVVGALKRGVAVEIGGRVVVVPRSKLDRLTLNRQVLVKVARGDRLQIRANRRMENGDVLTNGEIATVQEIVPDGTIVLADGRKIEPVYREFLPGYAVNSYGSQGKTVDFILLADSAVRAATDRRQWYVSISRSRRGIRIFTPDKGQLRENVGRSGDRPLAMDLVRVPQTQARTASWQVQIT